ncbi:MAG: alanyl-tRNA editing protein [Propionibacteriales bacterium]|nr:alanyl-tRNA editing protein [Propionibacteriales bacterium]
MNLPLYWRDQQQMSWAATVVESGSGSVVLDESAFYPGGGGQPADVGVLEWAGVFTRIDGVSGAGGLVPVEGDPVPPRGTPVVGRLDDVRRRSLMRTHSALHVVCGVVYRDFGALVTGSAMEPLAGRLDFNLPDVPDGFKTELERIVNEEVVRDRAIRSVIVRREDALAGSDVMRTARFLIPPEVEQVRIIDVVGLDAQADAGTHVASTRQIGEVSIAKVESKGKGFRRVRIVLTTED